MDPSSLPESQSQPHSQPGPAASAGPQIRSRVTVVCAECKRLKLKCDRRTPCGSCTKRDTVARCVYSPAAAEKVDLHSLNNRLIQVESQLAQFTAPGARSHNFYNNAPGPSTHLDRPLLAVGLSGSSLAISLDDITAIWLDELELSRDILPIQPSPSYSSCPSYASSPVKVESTPISLAAQEHANSSDPPVHFLLPSLSTYYASSSPSASETPSVTAKLLAQLPFAPRRRQKLYDNVEDVLKMHPCFNFKHFKDRAEAMFKWSSDAEGNDNGPSDLSATQNGSIGVLPTKAETARAIFFGSSAATIPSSRTPSGLKPTLSFFASVAAAFALGTLVDREIADEETRLEAAHGDGVSLDDPSSSRPSKKRPEQHPVSSKKSKGASKEAVCSPAVLFALSQQALSMFEKSSSYDLDFLVAMILHVLYALHDSKARVAHSLLPDVGKMVNVARTMGLDSDPDEFPGKFNLFEAESRRRLWWDIFYYDLFISDFMGRSPLISDMDHTTRLPMDVDEEVFTPACTTIPLPRSPLSLLELNSSDFKYFGLKCRLAQLVKDIKRRSLRDSIQNDPAAHEQFTLEQAASCANEIKQWLADLPSTFRLDIDSDLGIAQVPHAQSSDGSNSSHPSTAPTELPNVSPILLAQRCELAVTAQRLIMKVYIPFLRPSYGHGNSTSYYQATVGTFTAAHVIIRSLRVLFLMWTQRPDLRGRRPVPALFSFYSFGRTLFDAAVVCAHNVIKDPNSVWVQTAVEDVNCALEVLRDPMLNTGRGPMRGGVEGGVHEAIQIIELLQRKAENARAGNSDAASAGTKRKFDELEADVDQLRNGFQLPFVSAAVISAGSSVPVVPSDRSPPHSGARPTPAPPSVPSPEQHAQKNSQGVSREEQTKRPPSDAPLPSSIGPKRGSDSSKCKDKHGKKPPYPQTGIRVRTGKELSPFTKLRNSPSNSSLTDSEPTVPSMRHVPSMGSGTAVEHPSYQQSQQSAAYPQASQTISTAVYHSSTSQSLENSSVDFSLPFGAADRTGAQAQMSLDMSQSRRYCQAEMNQDVSSSQQVSKVTPPIASYERTHSAFAGSSPASYAPSSGTYSNISSPYPSGSTQYSTAPSHDQRPSSFEMHTPTPTFYPYDAQPQSHPMTLVGVNHDGEEISFQMRDHAVSQDSGLFQYSHDKSHQGMYAPERHAASVPHSPFQEQHHSMAQTWSQQTGGMSEEGGFWRPYDRFTA